MRALTSAPFVSFSEYNSYIPSLLPTSSSTIAISFPGKGECEAVDLSTAGRVVKMYRTINMIPASPPKSMPIFAPVLRPSSGLGGEGVVADLLIDVTDMVVSVEKIEVGNVGTPFWDYNGNCGDSGGKAVEHCNCCGIRYVKRWCHEIAEGRICTSEVELYSLQQRGFDCSESPLVDPLRTRSRVCIFCLPHYLFLYYLRTLMHPILQNLERTHTLD